MTDNVFDLIDQAKSGQAATNVYNASTSSADAAARAQRAAVALGLPAETAQRNLPDVERQVTTQNASHAIQGSPATRDWLTDPDNAAVAHDHVPLLTSIGHKLQSAFSGAASGTASVVKGLGSLVDSVDYALTSPAERQFEADYGRGPTFSQQVAPLAAPLAKAGSSTAVPNPTGGDKLAEGVGGFVPLITAAISDPLLGIGVFGASGAQNAQEDAAAHGATESQASKAVIGNAAIQSALGAIPIEGIAGKLLPSVAKPAANVLKNLAVAGAGGAVLGAGMQAGENTAAKLTFDPNRQITAGVGESAAQMGLLGLIAHGALHIPGDIKQARDASANAAASKAQTQDFNDAVEMTREAPLTERSPDRLQDLIKRMAPDENVYVPAEKVRDYMQSKLAPADQQAFIDATGIGEQLKTATDGADIIFPADTYLARVAPTEAHDAFKSDLRLSPDGMSQADAANFEKHYADFIAEKGTDLQNAAQAEAMKADPGNRVFADVRQQAIDAGYTDEAAKQYAALYAARYETRAAQFGTDAFHEYQKAGTGNGVDIRQELPPEIQAHFDKLDAVIDALRKGSKPNEGPSLLDFMSRNGGVKDDGGELSQLDAEKWHTGKPFRSKLVRPDGTDLEGMAHKAQDAGYLPETFDADGYPSRATGPDLVEAVARELRGDKVLATPLDGRAKDFKAAVDQLDALLGHQGIDPKTATNTEIKKAIEAYGREGDGGRSFNQTERGNIKFGDGPAIIKLFQGRDLSTLVHETGHLWLEELKADAARPDAPDQVKADWETIQKHLGVEGEIQTEQHEAFARSFEAYVMEGKAPSEALRGAFQRFKAWLTNIYRQVSALNVNLTPEIRSVFDRMLASEDEIKSAQTKAGLNPIFKDAEAGGMTQAEYGAYTKALDESNTEAKDALLTKLMATIRRTKTKEWAEERTALRPKVSAQIDALPDVKAFHYLTKGELLGTEEQPGPVKLDRKASEAVFGDPAILDRLPRGITTTDGGVHPDLIAELTGHSAGEAMLSGIIHLEAERRALRDAGKPSNVRKALTDRETDAQLMAKHGDPLHDGTIAEEAIDALHNDSRMKLVSMEVRALGKDSGEAQWSKELLEHWSKSAVDEMKVADLKPDVYLRAERKAGIDAQRHLLKGEKVDALERKRQQLLNMHLYRAAKDAADKVKAQTKRLTRIGATESRPSTDQEYMNQAHGVLGRMGFNTPSNVQERAQLREWLVTKTQAYDTITVPEWMQDEGINRTREAMTVSELSDVDGAITSILYAGRAAKAVTVEGRKMALADWIATVRAKTEKIKDIPRSNAGVVKESLARGALYAFQKVETLADHMDDGDANGPMNNLFIKRAADANIAKHELTKDVGAKILEARNEVPDDIRRGWLDKVETPGLTNPDNGEPLELTRYELIQIALNTGSESNLDKMLRGMKWEKPAVDAALAKLKPEEWQFVDKLWKSVGHLWPRIAETERQLSGLTPEAVVPRKVQTSAGELDGGYWPLARDPVRAGVPAGSDPIEEMFALAFSQASTPNGHVKARNQAAYPISLDLDHILNKHIEDVTTRIAYGPWIADTMRTLRDKDFKRLLADKAGIEAEPMMVDWLRRQVGYRLINPRDIAIASKFIRAARINTMTVQTGLSLVVGLEHATAYTQTIGKIGGINTVKGIGRYLSNPILNSKYVMDRSPEMAASMDAQNRDLRDQLDDLNAASLRQPSVLKAATAPLRMLQWASHRFISGISQYSVRIPTWLGAESKALAEGMTADQAARYADKVVRTTHGTGFEKDLTKFQSPGSGVGPEALKLFTMYKGYHQTQMNQLMEAGYKISRGDVASGLSQGFWVGIMSPVLAGVLLAGVKGGLPQKAEDWALYLVDHVLRGTWAGVPGIGEMANAGMNTLEGKPLQYEATPVEQGVVSTASALRDTKRVVDHAFGQNLDKDLSPKALQHWIEAPGYFLGLPTGQLARISQNAADVATGKVETTGPLDAARHVAYGTTAH